MQGIWYRIVLVAMAGGAAVSGQECPRVTGQVVDATNAVIVGAEVRVDDAAAIKTDAQGRFATACLSDARHRVRVSSAGFETAQLRTTGGAMLVKLKPSEVTTDVEVNAAGSGVDSQDVAGAKTINREDLKQLADDPDEFARQLQVLAAAAGGAPGAAIITVDGFQDSGRIPPKSSIAFIRINPDLFSAEYERPPYEGGRIEIYTKPGQDTVHGALFTTQSASWMNAADPYSLSKAALGRQRYGFELSGPLVKKKSDLALALEHREIDTFAVVNAVVVNGGVPTAYVQNVATPQSLWSGSVRIGWLVTPKNNLTATYTTGINGYTNLGVGGTSLQETGYGSEQSENAVRVTNLETVSNRVVHESRVGYTWRYREDTPNSTAPAVQVAGAFTGGGNTTGRLGSHERDLEVDDDVIVTWKQHSVKLGIETLDADVHDSLPTNFNGTFAYGGSATQTGLQQYALNTPTTYAATTGNAKVSFNQFRMAVYAQDQWKVTPRFSLAFGLRYAMEQQPGTIANFAPRFGLTWAPDKKQTWVIHVRSGLFDDPFGVSSWLESKRLDGAAHETQYIVYAPNATAPLSSGTSIATIRQWQPGNAQIPSWQSHVGVEHDLRGHWHVQANYYLARGWDILRSRNTNAPTNGVATGPRPHGANLNIFEYQPSAHLHGDVTFLGVDQHSLKHLQLFVGYLRLDLRSDADGSSSFPQGNSDVGETSRQSGTPTHHVFSFASLTLPKKVTLSTQFDATSGAPYNVTTGYDNNGDGVFNDRPSYKAASDPVGTVYYQTRFGLLTPAGTGPSIGRNAGTMPWNVHLDVNLSHTFALTHRAKGDGQNLAVNLRSTNVLNHTNVTAVGGVLGSPLFGQGYAADPGRRVEGGLRYSF